MSASVHVYRAFKEANVSDELAQRAADAMVPAAEGFARIEAKLMALETRLVGLEGKMDTKFASVESNIRWIMIIGGGLFALGLAGLGAALRLWSF